MLQELAERLGSRLGRDSAAIRLARPIYESILDLATGGRGYRRCVNGRESFYIAARNRSYFPEIYDPSVCDYLRQRVRPGDTCLNVGANVGIYTLLLARWSGPNGQVYAFEPNPAVRAILEDNVRRNGCAAYVDISNQAVGDEPGEAAFFAEGVTGIGRLGRPHPASGGASTFTVPVTTLDEFCGRHHLSPNWIVMDIEGFEIPALEGATETLRAGLQTGLNLVVEMHPPLWSTPPLSRGRMDAVLKRHSMRPIPLAGQGKPLDENGMCLLEHF